MRGTNDSIQMPDLWIDFDIIYLFLHDPEVSTGVNNRSHKSEDELNIWFLVFFTLILKVDSKEVSSNYLFFDYSERMILLTYSTLYFQITEALAMYFLT